MKKIHSVEHEPVQKGKNIDLLAFSKGGGGFRPIILETLVLRYELKGKARTRPDIFRVVLGPCAQFYPWEASEQKMKPNTKI